MANTIEPSMCGGDASLCQITLTTCLLNALESPRSRSVLSGYPLPRPASPCVQASQTPFTRYNQPVWQQVVWCKLGFRARHPCWGLVV